MDQVMGYLAFEKQRVPLVMRMLRQFFHAADKDRLTQVIQPDRQYDQQCSDNHLVESIGNLRVYAPADQDAVHPTA